MIKSRHFFQSVPNATPEFDQQFFNNLHKFNMHIIEHNESTQIEFEDTNNQVHKFDLTTDPNIWLHSFQLELTSKSKVVVYLQYSQMNVVLDINYNELSKKYSLHCNNIPLTFKSGEMTNAYLVINSLDTNMQSKLSCAKTTLHSDINDIPGIHSMYLFNPATKTNLLSQSDVWLTIELYNLRKFMNTLTQKIKDKYVLISTSPTNTII